MQERDGAKIAAGCGKGFLAYAALTVLGILAAGHPIDRTIPVQNRTEGVLAVAENRVGAPRHRVDARWTRYVPLFEDEPAEKSPTAVALFSSEDARRPVAVLRLDEGELQALREKRARIAIEPGRVLRMRVVAGTRARP